MLRFWTAYQNIMGKQRVILQSFFTVNWKDRRGTPTLPTVHSTQAFLDDTTIFSINEMQALIVAVSGLPLQGSAKLQKTELTQTNEPVLVVIIHTSSRL